MAKHNNVKDLCVDIANAIRAKKGTVDLINPQDFSAEISSITSGGKVWTGHADAEGLRAIGWTDEDIAYYQENGVTWNKEDDEFHKVSDYNKSLYGVITPDNISEFGPTIVYLPKIDTSKKVSMDNMFNGCSAMVGIPYIDTGSATSMRSMFAQCMALTCIPPLDTSNVTDMYRMFYYCMSLSSIPELDTHSVTNMSAMFQSCTALETIPELNTSNVTNMNSMFYYCYRLKSIPILDTAKVTDMNEMFRACYTLSLISQLDVQNVTLANAFKSCYRLTHIYLDNLNASVDLPSCALSVESLLHIIINAATNNVVISLPGFTYDAYKNNDEIVEALSRHTNVSLSQS